MKSQTIIGSLIASTAVGILIAIVTLIGYISKRNQLVQMINVDTVINSANSKCDELTGDHNKLRDEYEKLVAMYNKLTNDCKKSTNNYKKLTNNYKKLTNDYNNLSVKHSELSRKCFEFTIKNLEK